MTELKRWTEDGAPEAIERLLQAAESEQPSAASLAKALTSLGIAGAVTIPASGAAAGSAATGGSATSGAAGSAALTGVALQGKLSMLALTASLAKWIALGSVVGGTAVVAVHTVTDEAQSPSPAHSVAAQPTPPVPTAAKVRAAPGSSAPAAAEAGSEPALGSKPTRARSAGSPAARAASPASPASISVPEAIPAETLAQEIAGIDRARSLLAAGRYSATSAALDDYERRFPKHHFTPEVLYLRMEAALGAGRAQEARRLAQRLLAGYPSNPQSEKAKVLLGQKN